MHKPTHKERVSAAKKGAKTKANRKNVVNALQYKSMLDRGLSMHEVALVTGEDIRDILRVLKLLTLQGNPILKAIGIGATVGDIGLDAIERIQAPTPQASSDALNRAIEVTKVLHHNTINSIVPPELVDVRNVAHQVVEQIYSGATTALNQLGKAITGQK